MWISASPYPNVNQLSLKDAPEPLSSKHDLKLSYIQSRYRECTENHEKCIGFPQLVAPAQQLPSRLLDLEGDKIKLKCDIKVGDQLEYTTLSHMWGPDPSACLRLTLGVLDNFKAKIPETLLPTKFLEAIRITKALGFRYIWIDSLCIIQDSAEDWNTEARKMSAVYGRTSCNISYVYPPSDGSTKQHLRDPRIDLPCRISPNSSPLEVNRRSSLVVQHTEPPLRRHWSANAYKGDWPLLSRAWVFQERLLCPRNIYYGSDVLYWECCEAVQDEFYGPVLLSEGSKAEFYSVFSVDDQYESHRVRKLIGQWFSLVQAYRLGSLTYETDRIMAFAGVARAIQLQTNYLYLAGIWREFAELGLLWHIEPPWHKRRSYFQEFCLRKQQMQVAAPGWSWFSVPTIPDANVAQVDAVGFRICSSLCIRSPFAIYRAQIVSFYHPNLASDPDSLIYDFEGQSITLRAPMTPCTMRWDKGVLRVLPRGRYVLGDAGWQDSREAMDYCHDDFTIIPGSEPPTGAYMVLTILCASTLQDGTEIKHDKATSRRMGVNPGWQYAGLVVVPSAEKGCWRRVGVFVFTTKPRDRIKEVEVPFNWEDDEKDIVLV
ncbi:Fc.00g055710.m01.CDS01 [Cosmosporella sp. VM-42]